MSDTLQISAPSPTNESLVLAMHLMLLDAIFLNYDCFCCAGAIDGNAAFHILKRWMYDKGEGAVRVKPMMKPSPELEIVTYDKHASAKQRDQGLGYRAPPAKFIGKRRVIYGVLPPGGRNNKRFTL